MLKLAIVLFAVVALIEANNYQYGQKVRQLSASKSGSYGGSSYGGSGVQKTLISVPRVPVVLPKQSQYQSYQPQTPPPPPPPPQTPPPQQYQSYQPPQTTQPPPPPPPPQTPPPQQYQSYQPPQTTQPPPPPPPPQTPPPQQYQSYQPQTPPPPPPPPQSPPPPQQYQSYQPAPAPVPVPVPEMPRQQQYQSYQPAPSKVVSIIFPKSEQPSYGQQSSYGSSYGSGLGAAPSNPCVGRVPEEKIADPSNPSQFIVCLEEEQFTIMQCPINLVFNPNTLRCENTLRLVRACAANPCQNGGICTDLVSGQFRCDCQPGWTGDLCEKLDVCPPNACGPSGICIPLAQGSPLPKFCLCEGGQSFGSDCINVERNPCLTNDADLHTFPTRTNPAVFAHCEGNIPHLKFCLYPLIYNHDLQRCDWTQAPDPVSLPPSSSSSSYGSSYGSSY